MSNYVTPVKTLGDTCRSTFKDLYDTCCFQVIVQVRHGVQVGAKQSAGRLPSGSDQVLPVMGDERQRSRCESMHTIGHSEGGHLISVVFK